MYIYVLSSCLLGSTSDSLDLGDGDEAIRQLLAAGRRDLAAPLQARQAVPKYPLKTSRYNGIGSNRDPVYACACIYV